MRGSWKVRVMSRQWLKVLCLVLLNVIVVSLLGTHYIWRHSQAFVYQSQQALTFISSPEAVSLANLTAVQQHLQLAREELHTLQVVINPILSMTRSSQLGQATEEMEALWHFANSTNDLANELLAVAELAVVALEDGSPIENILTILPQIRPHLAKAEGYLAEAQAAREQIADVAWLPSNSQATLQQLLTYWDRFAPQLAQALPLSQEATLALPAFLGHKDAATYLVLIQNHDELRATGGFITGVGTIEIKNGQLGAFTVGKVTDAESIHEYNWGEGVTGKWVQPPLPISRYMQLGNWVFRDVNWMADFPTTAQQAAQFWQAEKGSAVDGVMALNEEGLEAIVQALGPVQLSSGEEISAQNLKEVTLAHVYQGKRTEWSKQQAKFSQELALALQETIQSSWIEQFSTRLSAGDLRSLLESLQETFKKRAILIHSFDAQVAPLLKQLDLDGALPTAEVDYFYLVEQNVSYNKLSQFIEQSLTYTVTLDSTARPIEASLTVEEENRYQEGAGWAGYPEEYYLGSQWKPGTEQLERIAGYYGGYSTLYLPHQAQLRLADGFDDEPIHAQQNNYQSIGAYVGLLPQEKQRLHYEWSYPSHSQPTTEQNGHYHLVVPRQPGAPVHELTITIELPSGYQAIHIDPTPTHIKAQQLIWQINLDQTQHIRLQLQPNN